MTLSNEERRALAIIAGLLVAASAARWLERPQPLLEDVPAADVAALEEASRAGKPQSGSAGKAPSGGAGKSPSGRTGSSAPDRAANTDRPIDPNTASAAELDRLPGVGPALAARIIEERDRSPFTTVGDLTRVPGIGAALATRLAGRVTLKPGPPRSEIPVSAGLTPLRTAAHNVSGSAVNRPLDLNKISSDDLQKVRGVGPVLASRLIARRDSLGRFRSWEQVDEVAGVGPAMLSRLKESLVLRP